MKLRSGPKHGYIRFQIEECSAICENYDFLLGYKSYVKSEKSGAYLFGGGLNITRNFSSVKKIHFYQGEIVQRIDVKLNNSNK